MTDTPDKLVERLNAAIKERHIAAGFSDDAHNVLLSQAMDAIASLRARLAQAEARIAEGREVVRPFARANVRFGKDADWVFHCEDDNGNDAPLTYEHFCRARAWLDAADQKGGDALARERGRAHETTPQPVEPPAGADVEVGEWRKIFRTPSLTEPTEGEVEAAARVFCSGLPPDSNAAASTPAGLLAKGRCWAPECNCWEEGKELTRAALRAAARARAPQGG